MAVAYVVWRIGREYFLTGKSTIRVLFASEVLELATRNLKWCKQIMDWNPAYQEICGVHKPPRADAQGWGAKGITSRFRRETKHPEPTIMPMGIDAERQGFHFDLMILDDMQAMRTVSSAEQIERVWTFYRLLHSILHKSGEMILLGTRWHYDDIYSRIEEHNKTEEEEFQFIIRKFPDYDPAKEGKVPYFPTVLPENELRKRRSKHGAYLYSAQYALDPVPDEERVFKEAWIKYRTPQMLNQPKLNVYTSADFAYTEENVWRKKHGGHIPDYTVIFTVAVDERWNYIFIDWYRERCSKLNAVREVFRQHYAHGSIMTVLQKYDRTQIADTLEQYAVAEAGRMPYFEWVTYPPRQSKIARIETNLQPLFEQHKVFLLENMSWFVRDELLDFPRGRSFDGLDALCNIVHVAKPTTRTKMKVLDNPTVRRIKALKAGVYDPDGKKNSWKNV